MKRDFFYIWIVLIVFSFFGCQGNGKNTENQWLYGTKMLVATKILSDSLILNPDSFNIQDSLLIVGESYNTRQFAVFQIRDDSLKKRGTFLNKGRGPYEVNAGRGYWIPENDLYVVIGFNSYGKTILIPVNEMSDFFSQDRWKAYDHPDLSSAVEIIPLDSVTLLIQKGSGKNDKMFALFDLPSGQMADLDTPFPEDNVNVPWHNKGMYIYKGRFGKRPCHDQFVYCSTNGQIVTIYGLENGRVSQNIPIYSELPLYQYSDSNIRKVKKEDVNKWGFHPIVTSEYIYLGDLKMTTGDIGRAEEKNGFPLGNTNEIQVFNWDGEPIVKLQLEKDIGFFAVDEHNRYLYGFTNDPASLESYLVRYELDF